jgi:hypothetical protein
MIGSTFNGFDQTSNFGSLTESEIAVSIGYHKSDPRKLSAKNLRNETSEAVGQGRPAEAGVGHQLTRCSRPSPSRVRSWSSAPSPPPAMTTFRWPMRR